MKTLNYDKPITIDNDRLKANLMWLLARLPSVLLTIPSAYGVASFASEKLPLLIAALAGFSFEAAMIGAIAIADQQYVIRRSRTAKLSEAITTSAILWWSLMLTAVLASALSNMLFFAGGTYSGITPEVITHSVPLPIVNFFYNLALHNAIANRKPQYSCPKGCGRLFDTQDSANGHMARCGVK